MEGDDWDYSSEYCEACAELGMTTCSCEPDGFEDEWDEEEIEGSE